MIFNYLGKQYTIPLEIYNTCKRLRATRRLFQNSTFIPCRDTKKYYFFLFSYYNNESDLELKTSTAYSTDKRYLKKFYPLDIAVHLKHYPLDKDQCTYLTKLLPTDFRVATALAREELKVFS